MSQFPWTSTGLDSTEIGEETLAFADELPTRDPMVNYIVLLTQALVRHASNVEEPTTGRINVPIRADNSI